MQLAPSGTAAAPPCPQHCIGMHAQCAFRLAHSADRPIARLQPCLMLQRHASSMDALHWIACMCGLCSEACRQDVCTQCKLMRIHSLKGVPNVSLTSFVAGGPRSCSVATEQNMTDSDGCGRCNDSTRHTHTCQATKTTASKCSSQRYHGGGLLPHLYPSTSHKDKLVRRTDLKSKMSRWM